MSAQYRRRFAGDESIIQHGEEDGYQAARNAADGLCTRCGDNAPAPTEEWCGPCILEVETALAELEEDAA